jgi:hypothetical protein
LDFFHVSEYLSDASQVIFRAENKRKSWLEKSLHNLKHEDDAQFALLKEIKSHTDKKMAMKAKFG